jgi:hypothetical protein
MKSVKCRSIPGGVSDWGQKLTTESTEATEKETYFEIVSLVPLCGLRVLCGEKSAPDLNAPSIPLPRFLGII